MEFIAATIAFGLTCATVMLVGALAPRTPKPAKRKPVVTPYRGPIYNYHGGEVERKIDRLSRMVL